jgi:hypothetical protein
VAAINWMRSTFHCYISMWRCPLWGKDWKAGGTVSVVRVGVRGTAAILSVGKNEGKFTAKCKSFGLH